MKHLSLLVLTFIPLNIIIRRFDEFLQLFDLLFNLSSLIKIFLPQSLSKQKLLFFDLRFWRFNLPSIFSRIFELFDLRSNCFKCKLVHFFSLSTDSNFTLLIRCDPKQSELFFFFVFRCWEKLSLAFDDDRVFALFVWFGFCLFETSVVDGRNWEINFVLFKDGVRVYSFRWLFYLKFLRNFFESRGVAVCV